MNDLKKHDENRYTLNFESDDRRVAAFHLDGVPWYDAPLPNRFHRCWPQTKGWVGYFTRIWRCPCGGVCYDPDRFGVNWDEKNTRRTSSRSRIAPETTDEVMQFAKAGRPVAMSVNEIRRSMGLIGKAASDVQIDLVELSSINRYHVRIRRERELGLAYVRQLGFKARIDLKLDPKYNKI